MNRVANSWPVRVLDWFFAEPVRLWRVFEVFIWACLLVRNTQYYLEAVELRSTYTAMGRGWLDLESKFVGGVPFFSAVKAESVGVFRHGGVVFGCGVLNTKLDLKTLNMIPGVEETPWGL